MKHMHIAGLRQVSVTFTTDLGQILLQILLNMNCRKEAKGRMYEHSFFDGQYSNYKKSLTRN